MNDSKPMEEQTPDLIFTVEECDSGQRLDGFVSRRGEGRSRVLVQTCIRDRLILVNGNPSRAAARLKAGDQISVAWPPEYEPKAEAEDIPLTILFEDDDIIVINKQPGLVVHPNDNFKDGTLVNALIHHDPETFTKMIDENLRPGIVHRLDKDTSGALVIAKNLRARKALKAAFKSRDVEKTYLAIVIGEFGAVTGRVENLLGRHPVHRTKMAVVEENGKNAITNYRVLGTTEELSLMQIRIETGRTHQIRVHFAHLRHPVLGDDVYGGRQKGISVDPPRQMLHAWKLVIPHPVTGVKREFMAPPPEDFRAVLETAGLPMISGPTPEEPDLTGLPVDDDAGCDA
ncbi:MAG: RluA family pseudouridine synthase [Lentisphaeria bacterium]|nr:RluA family pseudouridine synthase [Lentisphaeria bacterium]